MRIFYSKIFYILLLLVIGIILFLLLRNGNPDTISISYYVSGSQENLGCLSIHVDDTSDSNEYSFDGGKNWQRSEYGAVYENGKTTIQVRNEKKEIIGEKEIDVKSIVNNAPTIKLDFDNMTINNKSNSQLLKGVAATSNGKDVISKVIVDIFENKENELLVSYLAIDNDKKCTILRELTIDDSGTTTIDTDGKWLWPTNSSYKISRGYGWYNGKFHRGLDIYGLARGSAIYAARDGIIYDINYNSSSGYYITIKHDNGYYSRYAHLQNTKGSDKLGLTSSSEKYVSVGQRVKANDIIGEIGSSGNSTGLHLHFEIWDGVPFLSQSYNPISFYK